MSSFAASRTETPMTMDTLCGVKVTVLSGGPSAEREVSLASGRAVAEALDALKCDVVTADISPDDLSALDREIDVAFIALHGTFGEDGEVQRILERRKIPYTGSDSVASERAMDKVVSKRYFAEGGVPTPRFDVVRRNRISKVLNAWHPPVVVKPINEGSSVDCYIVHEADAIEDTLRTVTDRHEQCLIESYIGGPELTVGILEDRALPICEIRTGRTFYDYHAKYHDNDTQYLFDGLPLDAEAEAILQSLSLAAHRALGCRDFSRVDWRLDANGDPYCLEVNTIPGFTDHSLVPKAAARAGMSFAALCGRLVELALKRS